MIPAARPLAAAAATATDATAADRSLVCTHLKLGVGEKNEFYNFFLSSFFNRSQQNEVKKMF